MVPGQVVILTGVELGDPDTAIARHARLAYNRAEASIDHATGYRAA
jgi:hypothetical protein